MDELPVGWANKRPSGWPLGHWRSSSDPQNVPQQKWTYTHECSIYVYTYVCMYTCVRLRVIVTVIQIQSACCYYYYASSICGSTGSRTNSNNRQAIIAITNQITTTIANMKQPKGWRTGLFVFYWIFHAICRNEKRAGVGRLEWHVVWTQVWLLHTTLHTYICVYIFKSLK